MSDDEYDTEALALFLADSDSEDEESKIQDNISEVEDCGAAQDDKSVVSTDLHSIDIAISNSDIAISNSDIAISGTDISVPSQSATDINALQNQILMMQKQMEQMQNTLQQTRQAGTTANETASQQTRQASTTANQTASQQTRQASTTANETASQQTHQASTTANQTASQQTCSAKTTLQQSSAPGQTTKPAQKEQSSAPGQTTKPAQKAQSSAPGQTTKPAQKAHVSACSQKTSDTPISNKTHSKSVKTSEGNRNRSKQELSKMHHNPFFDDSEELCNVEKMFKVPSVSDDARREQERSLFGDDSDWEELDGEETQKLSAEGDALQKLLHESEKGRVSYATKQDVEELRKRAAKTSWKERSPKQLSMRTKSGTSGANRENDLPSITDPFSGIRIINPRVSSTDMKYKMAERNLVAVSRIASQSCRQQENWVTIAVVVSKTEPRTSAAGKTYCIWKLSDLQDCDKTISFFLFGEVYKQHWKNSVGTVAGILNASIMDKAEKVQQDVAVTVQHPQQVMVMGQARDLGRCTGISKAGKPCTKFINKQQGDRCTYHVQSAYRKTSSHRSELQGSFTGMTPKAHDWKKTLKKSSSFFFYQGETFSDLRPPSSKAKDKVTVDKLTATQAGLDKGKVTTMSLHKLLPEDEQTLKHINDKKNEFVDLLTTPTVGSLNFVKHLVKEETGEKAKGGISQVLVQSITPKELLQQHKQAARERKRLLAAGRPINPLEAVPTLGKGCCPGSDISLEVKFPTGSSVGISVDLAKRKAIAKIQLSGGISREDPNAVRKTIHSPGVKDKVRKRVAENTDNSNRPNSRSPGQEPPKKRSKLLGNIDVDSEGFKQMMKVRSNHKGALAEVEAEQEEKYFMAMEKKEKYEDKMAATMEMKCRVFTCVQCQYTAFKPGNGCKENRHTIKTVEATKRFFQCKKCKQRTTTIHKFPTEPCRNCGMQNFERTSMHQERQTKTPSEELCIRGNELKYLSSLQETSFLNI